MGRWAILAAALCLGFGDLAQAQSQYEGCVDGAGARVRTVSSPALNDIAAAHRDGAGQAFIFINHSIAATAHVQTRIFFYFHECAHHVLGHTRGVPPSRAIEQEADCWAARSLIRSGRFTQNDLQVVSSDIARNGRNDGLHFNGRQRAKNLLACNSKPINGA